ncbi:hypothetical protein LPU83_pLPU83c_0554 (plasmid) [Rhizobium favelukesii]|uniref:Uncharacterized protein n=1 Tax=Rhizobium favelukesii TaxID=348824 RepID=W6S475_9HYPH|nr:hypothetical protein LPU83_pLPU83c_0554 [Rhizobium favelukesii]
MHQRPEIPLQRVQTCKICREAFLFSVGCSLFSFGGLRFAARARFAFRATLRLTTAGAMGRRAAALIAGIVASPVPVVTAVSTPPLPLPLLPPPFASADIPGPATVTGLTATAEDSAAKGR